MSYSCYPNCPDAYTLMHEGVLALAEASEVGMRINTDYCKRTEKELTKKIVRLERKFESSKLFKRWIKKYGLKTNKGSPLQLSKMLYEELGYQPPKFTATGAGAVDEDALKTLNIPEINILLEARKLVKLRDTYLKAFVREAVDGFVHPKFSLNNVKSFRSSSQNPNFQNIPKRDKEAISIVRGAIFPRHGNQLLEVDYSGAEIRAGVGYHQDPQMRKYIEDATTDMHRDMAMQIFKLDEFDKEKYSSHKMLRQAAKNGFVFPQFYGDYYATCAVNLACSWGKLPQGRWHKGEGIEYDENHHLSDHMIKKGIKDFNTFTEHVKRIEKDFWGRRFRVYQEWKDDLWDSYQHRGVIDLKTGFQCRGIMRKNEALNFPIQGAAFHMLLWSFTQFSKYVYEHKMKSRPIGQIHDAMVIDVYPPELETVKALVHEIMCEKVRKHWDWINVPLEAEMELCGVDESWDKKKDVAHAV